MNNSDLPHADKKVLAIANAFAKSLASELTKEKVFVPLGAEVKSSETPLILVHPFYYGSDDRNSSYYELFFEGNYWWNMPRENYLENMRKFLSTFQGNIYLYESEINFPHSLGVLKQTRKSLEGVYFLKTMTHSNVSESILKRFKDISILREISRNFLFAGGRVVQYSKTIEGCLGGLVSSLSNNGVRGKFVKGCCFR
jgi:hypothetical protein